MAREHDTLSHVYNWQDVHHLDIKTNKKSWYNTECVETAWSPGRTTGWQNIKNSELYWWSL